MSRGGSAARFRNTAPKKHNTVRKKAERARAGVYSLSLSLSRERDAGILRAIGFIERASSRRVPSELKIRHNLPTFGSTREVIKATNSAAFFEAKVFDSRFVFQGLGKNATLSLYIESPIWKDGECAGGATRLTTFE